jgi:hypothetical protein
MLHHPTWSATLADQHRLALSHRANQRQLARSGAAVKPQRQRASHPLEAAGRQGRGWL